MNAREVMQALLDGKTVEFTIGKLKLDENGTILAMWHHDECHDTEWHEADMLMNNPNFKIVEEYPLTFKAAMEEMANGKKVSPDSNTDDAAYLYDPETNVVWRVYNGIWEPAIFLNANVKWKVVE